MIGPTSPCSSLIGRMISGSLIGRIHVAASGKEQQLFQEQFGRAVGEECAVATLDNLNENTKIKRDEKNYTQWTNRQILYRKFYRLI